MREGDETRRSKCQAEFSPAHITQDRSQPPWVVGSFVYGLWAAMTATVTVLALRFAYNLPWQDEFVILDVLTGVKPLTLQWLWAEHNEHRIPAVKLILLLLYRWTGDFRAPIVLTIAALSLLALALIRTARQLRGNLSYTDGIFPLLLLHWGHAEIFLWGFEIQYTLSIVLTGLILLVSVAQKSPMRLGLVLLAGTCLVLLPLTGANGLVQVPVLAGWLFVAGTLRSWFFHPREQRLAVTSSGFVVAALLITGSYFISYQRHAGPQQPGLSIPMKLHAALQFLTGGFGPGAAWYWPWSGYLTAALFLLGGLILAWRLGRGPMTTRVPAFGLLSFLGSLGCLTLAMGWGRSFVGFLPPFFIIRYYSLAALAPCALYLIWADSGSRRQASMVQVTLFAIVGLLTPFNFQVGMDWAHAHQRPLATMTQEIQTGTTAQILAEHHRYYLYPWESVDWVATRFERLRQQGIGPFRSLRATPPTLQEVVLTLEPSELNRVSRLEKPGCYFVRGDRSALGFTLPEPRRVYAIRVKCAYDDASNAPVTLGLTWEKPTGPPSHPRSNHLDFGIGDAFGALWPGGTQKVGTEPKTATFLIDDTITRFQIEPAQSLCGFQLLEITLLVTGPDMTASKSTEK